MMNHSMVSSSPNFSENGEDSCMLRPESATEQDNWYQVKEKTKLFYRYLCSLLALPHDDTVDSDILPRSIELKAWKD